MANVSKIKLNDETYNVKDAEARKPVDEELAKIRNEGSTQVSAIGLKGQEVLESIPEEYAALSGDVSALKSAMPRTVKAFGILNAAYLSQEGYTDLIQLPRGYAYAVPSAVSINGKPEGLQNTPFTFIAIPGVITNDPGYTVYLAVGKKYTFVGYGYTPDTAITWTQLNNDESAVVTDIKNRINTIIGERTIKWEPGCITTVRNQAVDYTNITRVNQYVHSVVDVTPGDVLHITAKYDGIVVFATVSSAGVQIGDSGNSSFTDRAYTIPSGVAKIIVNSPINYPYDVYFDTTTLTSINGAIANLNSKTIQTHGHLTASFISDGGYSNLIDLPYNRVYSIPGALSINGKPSGFQNAPFTFLAIAPNSGTSAAYRVYFAIGKDETYYGFGYQGDTTISWKRADTGDRNIMYLKSRINSILGDLNVTWEPGRIVSTNNQAVDYTNVVDTDRCVHCVVDVTPGKVVHITGTYCKSPIFCTVNANGVQNRVSPSTGTYNDLTYTIQSDTVKLIINALAANPYDVWVETDSIGTLKSGINALSNTVDIMAKKPFDTINHNKIVLLGDSVVQGVGSSDYSPTGEALNTNIYPTQRNVGVKCWGSRIVALLNDEYGCTAVNNGVSQFGMNHLQDNLGVLLPNDTDYAVVMIGTNNRNSSKANCRTMFESLMDAIIARGVQPFVFSPIPMNTGTSSLGMGNMQKIFENVCREKGIPFFPLFTNFGVYISEHGLELSSCYADWGHPNDKGHEIIFNYVRKCLGI